MPGDPRYSFSDLPARIDYVLTTHGHDDHYELSSLLRLRHRIGCLVVPRASGLLWDYSLKAVAQRIGFKHVVELDAFDSLVSGPDMEIVSFAADSKTHDPHLYENVQNITGNIQTVFIGTCCVGQTVEDFSRLLFDWFEPGQQAAAWEEKSGFSDARMLSGICDLSWT